MLFHGKVQHQDEQKANSAIGSSSSNETYQLLSKISGLKNYSKNIKDRYDHFFPHRVGHKKKDNQEILSNSEAWPQQDVFDELKDKTFEDVVGIVNEILKKQVEVKKVTEENQNLFSFLTKSTGQTFPKCLVN